MTTTESSTTPLVPFFTDERSVDEQLSTERRDWIPTKPETDSPAQIGGLVLELGNYHGLNERVSPTLTVLDADGTEWGVIAFHGFLRSAIERQAPQVGDWVAIRYCGTKPTRKAGESDAYKYALIIRRNPNAAAVATSPPTGLEAQPELEPQAEPEPPEDDGIPF